jgi:hypothetical protein
VLAAPPSQPWSIYFSAAVFSLPPSRATLWRLLEGGLRMLKMTKRASTYKSNGATLGFEKKLWAAADKLRGSMIFQSQVCWRKDYFVHFQNNFHQFRNGIFYIKTW